MNKKEFDFSVLQEISESFVKNPVVEIQFMGLTMPVEIEIKPSEAFISMEINPMQNNTLLQVVLKALKDNPEFKAKMNGKKIEQLGDVFDNEFELLEMLPDEVTNNVLNKQIIERDEFAKKAKLSNQRIVMNCAVHPRFIETEKFEADKVNFATANPPVFPVELIDEFDLARLADAAIGKRVIWGEKAEALGKSTLPNEHTGFDSERDSVSTTGEGMEEITI